MIVSGTPDCRVEIVAPTDARARRADLGNHSAGHLGVVIGRTPDGRTFNVAAYGLDADVARVLALVHRPGRAGELLVDAGPLDPDAPLPYAVRLPAGQGWVIANVGATFRYRPSPDAGWRSAGRDAALLPDAAAAGGGGAEGPGPDRGGPDRLGVFG